jgi:hypothetical protein
MEMDSIIMIEPLGVGYIKNILKESLRPGAKTGKFFQGL